MTNAEIYDVISESLQNDIDNEKITCEYANILNDIAYDIYVENASVNEEVTAILDKYISEATDGENDEDEAIDDAADAIKAEYESANELLHTIEESFNSGEISENEMNILTEAVTTKFEYRIGYYAGVESIAEAYSEGVISFDEMFERVSSIGEEYSAIFESEDTKSATKDKDDLAKYYNYEVAEPKKKVTPATIHKAMKDVTGLAKARVLALAKYNKDNNPGKKPKLVSDAVLSAKNYLSKNKIKAGVTSLALLTTLSAGAPAAKKLANEIKIASTPQQSYEILVSNGLRDDASRWFFETDKYENAFRLKYNTYEEYDTAKKYLKSLGYTNNGMPDDKDNYRNSPARSFFKRTVERTSTKLSKPRDDKNVSNIADDDARAKITKDVLNTEFEVDKKTAKTSGDRIAAEEKYKARKKDLEHAQKTGVEMSAKRHEAEGRKSTADYVRKNYGSGKEHYADTEWHDKLYNNMYSNGADTLKDIVSRYRDNIDDDSWHSDESYRRRAEAKARDKKNK